MFIAAQYFTDQISLLRMPPAKFIHALLPVLFLLLLIIFGLILRPMVWGLPAIPLEIIFFTGAVFAISELMLLGVGWNEIQESIVKKLSSAMPVMLIILFIGVIIGSWIVSGTIPMMVYYGLKIVDPDWFYLVAFLVPIIFSTLTGTSYGSAGTIGVVIMGIAMTIEANPGITAGAIIGGAFFGDKLSPLSDTTNVAALAAEVDLYAHIGSMMYTTLPSMVLAALIYSVLGFVFPISSQGEIANQIAPTLRQIEVLFKFNPLLLLPPAVVLYGSVRRKPTLPTFGLSVVVAAILAIIFQPYSFTDIVQSLYKGFDTSMAFWVDEPSAEMMALFNRGGVYALSEPVIIAIFVFIYIGTLDRIQAMQTIVSRLLKLVKSRSRVILSSLFSTAITNAMTSNQFATSFVIGDAFKSVYDRFGISRKVLSRSLEDYGTMIETMIPWHTSSIFMVATLGVAYAEYWNWQLMTLINLIIAPLFAILGIGCFYNQKNTDET